MINQGAGLPLDRALALEAQALGGLFASHDQAEGMAAFLEKRPAQFKGQ